MKKTKTAKVIAVALLCTLLVGAAVGIGISANTESGESVATIGMKNLAYNDMLNLAIGLTQVKEEGTLGLGVWAAGTEELTAENAIHITYDTKATEVGNEVIVYAFSQGIAAKDIDTKYIFAAVVESEGTLYIGQTMEYSVDAYIDDLLGKDGVTGAQKTLCEAVKAYGSAASDVLE